MRRTLGAIGRTLRNVRLASLLRIELCLVRVVSWYARCFGGWRCWGLDVLLTRNIRTLACCLLRFRLETVRRLDCHGILEAGLVSARLLLLISVTYSSYLSRVLARSIRERGLIMLTTRGRITLTALSTNVRVMLLLLTRRPKRVEAQNERLINT